jgi:hypothetical protein
MGTFGKSFSRELGKNTGKWASNKLFGDKWSTPYRVTVQRERQERKELRDSAREYKQYLLEEKKEERNEIRQLKQREKEDEQHEKELIIDANTREVKEHNNYFDVIQSVHRDYSDDINWNIIINQPPPKEVNPVNELEAYYREYTDKQVNEKIAEVKKTIKLSMFKYILSKFYTSKYSWLFKIPRYKLTKYIFWAILLFTIFRFPQEPALNLSVGLLLLVTYQILKAGSKDFDAGVELSQIIESLESNRTVWFEEYMREHHDAYLKYLKDIKDHKELLEIAAEMKNNNKQAYMYAVNFFKPFEDLKEYGSDVSITINGNLIEVDFYVRSDDVIPKTTKRLLRKGLEIGEDFIPTSRFNEIYQDYVCSCILRIGKEIFALLPVHEVLVNAMARLLNTSTGMHEEQIIVSVLIENEILKKLNFDLLDPSDSISNFKNNMNFKKLEGFYPVSELILG